jgi:oligopeptide/dipeptide ABC transporter ATP-binding protein
MSGAPRSDDSREGRAEVGPRGWRAGGSGGVVPPRQTQPLLTVRDLRSYLATRQGVVRAVDGVSLTVHEAEVLGIVGESGCGKTVTCRTIMGLMPPGTLHASGEVIYHPNGEQSILNARPAQMQALRGSHLAMIFQDPMTALNPVRTIGDQLLEAVNAHAKLSRSQAQARALGLLDRVGIPAPTRRMRDYPFQFSGGMLQRALIAIALASSPRLLLADEPTTSLDVIIQDQILSLLLELQQDTGMSMILVSHDLAVITEVCDRIIVMYAGQVVEEGAIADIITAPRHPYTQALLDALPHAGRRGHLRSIRGAPPSLIDVPDGCRFAPRCRYVTDQCLSWDTELVDTGERDHTARCWRQDELGRSQACLDSDSA